MIWWQNVDEQRKEFILKAFDIEIDKTTGDKQNQVNNGAIKYEKDVIIKKVYKRFKDYYQDNRKFDEDVKGVCCESNGIESIKEYGTKEPLYNKNIIGYLDVHSFGLDAKVLSLTRCIGYQPLTQSYGFYLRSDNYVEKLPLFCAKLYPQANWYERDVYFTTADGGLKYLGDSDFVKSCVIFTCLSQRNKCISFLGSDDRFYKNELCFDTETLAQQHLQTLKCSDDDQKLLDLWGEVLSEGKKCAEYGANKKYGTYQIIQELNTFYKNDKNKKIYNYPVLNTNLNSLKEALKIYYANNIEQKLFEYELLK